MVDTLDLFKRLTNAGMEESQAEIIATELWKPDNNPQEVRRLWALGSNASSSPEKVNGFMNWYGDKVSTHPMLTGMFTGLVLWVVESLLVCWLFGVPLLHLWK